MQTFESASVNNIIIVPLLKPIMMVLFHLVYDRRWLMFEVDNLSPAALSCLWLGHCFHSNTWLAVHFPKWRCVIIDAAAFWITLTSSSLCSNFLEGRPELVFCSIVHLMSISTRHNISTHHMTWKPQRLSLIDSCPGKVISGHCALSSVC